MIGWRKKKAKPFVLDVAWAIGRNPGAGRCRNDCEDCGEEFRERYLIPALIKYGRVRVELGSCTGFGSGWLNEVFGELVRKYGPTVVDRIEVSAVGRPGRAMRAEGHMKHAFETLEWPGERER